MPDSAADPNQPNASGFYTQDVFSKSYTAAIAIFLVVCVFDFVTLNRVPVYILQIIILVLCVAVSYTFVVKKIKDRTEKIWLGAVNACVLFGAVIGVNATFKGNAFTQAKQSNNLQVDSTKHLDWNYEKRNQPELAGFGSALLFRSWMPPVELTQKIEQLEARNAMLRDSIGALYNSIIVYRDSVETFPDGGTETFTVQVIPAAGKALLRCQRTLQQLKTSFNRDREGFAKRFEVCGIARDNLNIFLDYISPRIPAKYASSIQELKEVNRILRSAMVNLEISVSGPDRGHFIFASAGIDSAVKTVDLFVGKLE